MRYKPIKFIAIILSVSCLWQSASLIGVRHRFIRVQALRALSVLERGQTSIDAARQRYLAQRYVGFKTAFLRNKIFDLWRNLSSAGWQDKELKICVLAAIATYVADEIHTKFWNRFFDEYRVDFGIGIPIDKEHFLEWTGIPTIDGRVRAILRFYQGDRKAKGFQAAALSANINRTLETNNFTAEAKTRRRTELIKRSHAALAGMDGALERKRRRLVADFAGSVTLLNKLPFRDDKKGVYAPGFKCDIACRHCLLVDRGLTRHVSREERFAKLQELLDRYDREKKVIVQLDGEIIGTPGEVEILLYVLRHSTKPVSFVTNVSWASTPQAARGLCSKLLAEVSKNPYLATVSHPIYIQLSFDDFHQEIVADEQGRLRRQVDIENIANAIQIIVEEYQQLRCALISLRTAGLAMLTDELGAALDRRGYILTPLFHRLDPITGSPIAKVQMRFHDGVTREDTEKEYYILKNKTTGKKVTNFSFAVVKSFMFRTGWAELLEDFEYIHACARTENFLFNAPCTAMDGNVVISSMFLRVWSIGNIYDESLDEIIARAKSDPLVWMLAGQRRELIEFAREVEPELTEGLEAAGYSYDEMAVRIFHEPALRLYITQRFIQSFNARFAIAFPVGAVELGSMVAISKIVQKTTDQLMAEYHLDRDSAEDGPFASEVLPGLTIAGRQI